MLSFQLSPIILCNGVANEMPGGVLPIIAVTESVNLVLGSLSGSLPSLDSFFAYFEPMPGGTLGENQIAQYPFANQAVAANAIIQQPLMISMKMICPARGEAGYLASMAAFMTLRATLDQHDRLGGTYTIVTPRAFYTNCVRLRMVDISSGESKQPQHTFQIDFQQPLLTLEAAQQAQNSLMSRLTNGSQINGDPSYSGAAASIGNPSSLAGIAQPGNIGGAAATTAPLPVPPVPPSGVEVLST